MPKRKGLLRQLTVWIPFCVNGLFVDYGRIEINHKSTLDLNPALDMGFLRFEYVKETKNEIQEEKWRIEPTIWREALIQRYYLRLENPFVSG